MNQTVRTYKITPREKQVLHYLAHGMVCKQIAHQLSICETTVITYKNRLKEKLNVSNCYELIYKTSKMGII